MASTTQTTQQIADTIVAQVQANTSQVVPLWSKAFTRVLAKALAGVIGILWRYAGFQFLQLFVRYATYEETTVGSRTFRPLQEWGDLFGVARKGEGERAELVIAVDVTNQTGSLPANTQLLRSTTGVIYITTAAVSLDAPTVNPTIRAVSDQGGNGGVGDIGNLDAGDEVRLINPVPNVQRTASVVSTTTQGADAETVESYRLRIIRKVASRPQGGALADYSEWGEVVTGIVNVYPWASELPGEMDIYVEATPASSGDPDGIPTQAQLDAVEDAIILDDNGLASRRPAGVEYLNMYGITRTGFDVAVVGLNVDNEPEVQDGVEDALTEYFLDRGPYIGGLHQPPRKDRVSQADVAGIVAGIVTAHGGVLSDVYLYYHGESTEQSIIYLGHGEKAKVVDITYPS